MRYYYYYEKKGGPFWTLLTVLGAIVFLLGFFFLALPIFLAAFAVFSGVALYVGWRMKRALKKMEKELDRELRAMEERKRCDFIEIEKEPLD